LRGKIALYIGEEGPTEICALVLAVDLVDICGTRVLGIAGSFARIRIKRRASRRARFV
jgi:hypothetical protein